MCACPKPGPGFLMSCHGLLIFVCLSQARAWISNVICHGLLIFVCLSQARAWISNVICHGLLIFVGLSKARGLDF